MSPGACPEADMEQDAQSAVSDREGIGLECFRAHCTKQLINSIDNVLPILWF